MPSRSLPLSGRARRTLVRSWLAVAACLGLLAVVLPAVVLHGPWAAPPASRREAAPEGAPAGADAPAVLEEHFERGGSRLPAGWRAVSLDAALPATRYAVVQVDGRSALQGEADGAASSLVWERTFDPRMDSVVEWEWKIRRTLPRGDLTVKEREDVPARLMVLFPYDPEHAGFWERMQYDLLRALHGEYPPAAALYYVWSNRAPAGSWHVSTYTERVRILAVESGDARAGQWRRARRDIAADYRRAFGGEVPARARLAVMVDADNTQDHAVGWFDSIRVRPGRITAER